MINIKGLDKAELFANLFNCFANYYIDFPTITIEEARDILYKKNHLYYNDMVFYRLIKVIDLSNDEFDEEEYEMLTSTGQASYIVYNTTIDKVLKENNISYNSDYKTLETILAKTRQKGEPLFDNLENFLKEVISSMKQKETSVYTLFHDFNTIDSWSYEEIMKIAILYQYGLIQKELALQAVGFILSYNQQVGPKELVLTMNFIEACETLRKQLKQLKEDYYSSYISSEVYYKKRKELEAEYDELLAKEAQTRGGRSR